nr:Transposase, MuDR, plant [Ipomoea trifida]
MVVNLGYKLDEIKSIYYGELESTGGSLKILFDDESVHGMCVLLEKSGNVSLFVEHTDCVGQAVTHAEIPIPDSFFETINYGDKIDETETMGSEGERCENTVEANVEDINELADNELHSDYISSSDPGSYKSTSEASDVDDAQRKRSSGLHYKPNGTFEDFFLEQIFNDSKQFKLALSEFSLKNQFAYTFKKNDSVRVRAKCSATGCKWEILASIHGNDNSFRVKTYHSEHNCLPTSKNSRVTSKIIGRKLKDDITKMPWMKARNIRALVRKQMGLTIDLPKARRAKLIVMKEIQQSYIDEFKRLREYADELLSTNIGSTVKLEGLLRSISDLLPFVEQRMCARHIYARWGKRFRGDELKFQFWICARSPNKPEFEKNMATLKQINEEAHDYLKEQWDPIHWCQAFFSDFSKCDVIDNNMCETLNGVILEARCKPIISMLEEIRVYIMRRLVKNREYGRNWKTDYAPRQLQKLEKNRKLAAVWEVDWNGGDHHEERSCSCRGWDISGVPCQHAISAIMYEGQDPRKYLDNYFKKDVYLKAYHHMLHPVKGPMFWPKGNVEEILPPYVKKVFGRPQKERRREELEGRKKVKMSRIGRKMKCSICRQEGHNKLRCPRVVDPYYQRPNIQRTKEMKNDASKQTRPKASHPTQVPCQTGSYEPSQNANMQAQADLLPLTPAGSSHHTQNATIKQSKKISIVNPGKSNKYVVATSNTGSCISLGQLQEIKREKAKGKLQSSIRARDSTSFSAQESINYSLDS